MRIAFQRAAVTARVLRGGGAWGARDGGRKKIPSVRWFSTVYITIAVISGHSRYFLLSVYLLYVLYL